MTKSKKYGKYVRFEEPMKEMTWPLPDQDLNWVLRYGNPTREQLLHAASILSAYYHAVTIYTQKKRNYVFGELKKYYIGEKE